jgi:hypothetical protein
MTESEAVRRLHALPPVKIGNRNKTGKCGMCGIKVEKLYPQTVGQVEFMICENCKSIMDM